MPDTKLVIVESPAKARTIAGFLGPEYVVESSIGHVRDLPRNAADVPSSLKQEPWSRLGVDTENDFKPLYIVPKEKKDQIKKLKRLAKDAAELYLATDEDREGESIAWHLTEVLNPTVPVKRMVFHEITPEAMERAVQDPRDLDRRLIDAQETRRILDRLFGYEVSPVLWRLVRPKLSAGRVQSPAIRIIVDRERERIDFTTASYWDLEGTFGTDEGGFTATLTALDGVRLATGKDFDAAGKPPSNEVVVLDEPGAEALVDDLAEAVFAVRSVDSKPYKRSPYPPFRTSTLQQEASRKLRFASQRTMQVAQRLYENGYITYMRTDSMSLSETATRAARAQVQELYGAEFLPDVPRTYAGKVRNAQEAHEAIRPAGDRFRTPKQVASQVSKDEARLYELVWKRTVASQMADARGESVQVRLGATSASGRDAEFSASGKVIHFPGFLRAYVEGSDDPDADLEDQEHRLPPVAEGDVLRVAELKAKGHETKPPSRFTEASLVKRLEELGIGRPSTYASIIETIQDRGYVWKKGSALVPTFTAFATVRLLEKQFEDLVDFEFTARMEDDLDSIARGDREMIPYLAEFYFGNGHPGLVDLVKQALDEADAREINTIPFPAARDGLELRSGRYGPYLQVGEETVSIPEDLPPDELTPEKVQELLDTPSGDRELGVDPDDGRPVWLKFGRFGPYVQLGDPDDDEGKPKTASLFSSMDPDGVDIGDALRLLSLPRTVGMDPSTDEPITAQNGRYGPYLKRGDDSRSLETEEEIFEIGLEEALALFAQPKRGGRRTAAPLRELGVDPETGCAVVVKDGRFGPYVTDGSVNASLKRHDAVDKVTLERALELLEQRRERMRDQGKKIKPCPKVGG